MRHQNKDKQSQLLELFSQKSSYEAEFNALTLLKVKFSKNSEKTVLLITYLQLASQIFLLDLHLWSSAPPENSVKWFIVSAFKLINSGSLFVFQGGSGVIWTLLAISIAVSLYKYINFLYILCIVILKTEFSPILVRIWKVIFQLQGRVLYSLLSSIWISILVKALQDELTIPGFGKVGTLILMIGFLMMEFMFCLVLQLRYYPVLPAKSLFSSKSPAIEAITLTQKFILQILQMIFTSIPYKDDWIIRSVCAMLSLIRAGIYFKTLPIYSIKGLRYHGMMAMIIMSLDITCLFQKIVLPEHDLNFIMTVWIVLSLILTRLSDGYTHRKILWLALSQAPNTSSEVIQKINFIKQLGNYRRQHQDPKKDIYLHLINSTIRKNLTSTYKEKHRPQNIINYGPDSKDDLYQIFISYLESMQATFSKDELLKLYMAAVRAKTQQYGAAMSLLVNLQRSSTTLIAINTTILFLKIQEEMKQKQKSETIENKLNIHDYLKAQVVHIKVQKKILQQMDLQTDLYQEMRKDTPDLSRIFNQGQNIDNCRQRIEKEIKSMMNSIPDYYVDPLLICGYYYLVANNSLVEFSRYLKIYSHRMLKYTRSFECKNIVPENCYQESNAFVLVSGQKESLGRICFCTESLAKIYGGDINLYLGADVSAIAPNNHPSFDFLSSILSNEKSKSAIGHLFRGYCKHRAGYLIEVEFYIDIFPLLTKGFYYCILIRPISKEKPILMITNGKNMLYNPKNESEPLQVADTFKSSNEGDKPEEIRNATDELASENMYPEEVEKDCVKNSTIWKPDFFNNETTRRYKNINENIDLDGLASHRTESALLTKYDGTDRKLLPPAKTKLNSIESKDQYRGNFKKDNRSPIDEENSNKMLENTEQERISQTLNLALVTRFNWRPLRIAYAMFYLLLLSIVVAQVVLKNEINDTMNELKTKKEVLGDAQNRDYILVNIARSSWFFIDEVTGFFKTSFYTVLGVTISTYLSTLNTNMKALTKANQNLQANAGLLTASLRKTLFAEDIRLYINTTNGVVTTNNMTNFQAIDYQTQTILNALMASKTNLTQAANIFQNVVVYNSLNDLLIKTESTTQLFSNSIESDTNGKRLVIQMTFIAFVVCLTIISLILLRIIFLIYSKEKSNMLMLIKLDTNAIIKLQLRLDTFKKLLETESLIKNKASLQSLKASFIADFHKKYRTRTNLQIASYRGIIKKYLWLATRYLLCNYAIIPLMAWSSFSASDSIQSLHTEQVRLTFSNEMAKTYSLAFLAYRQLYTTGGTAKIRNEPCNIQLNKAIDLLDSYRTKALSLFQDPDGEYDPLIGKILVNPTCKDIIATGQLAFCGYLAQRQNQIGLASLLSQYQGLLTAMRDSYFSSNKTLSVLQALQGQNLDLLTSAYRTLLDETTTIANRINVIFKEKFEKAERKTKLILIIILILVPTLGYGAWIFVFKQLRESDNKFKNVLKSFPANLLLSNFLLKAYLLNTSRSILDPIRSYL